MSKSKTKLKRKEIIIYSIASFLAFAGLFFLILGIVGDHLPLVYSDNWIRKRFGSPHGQIWVIDIGD